MDILVESKKKVIPNAPVITKDTSSTSRGGNAVPSGFILKLYQMVNGAPDEVITVSFLFSSFSIASKKMLRFSEKPETIKVDRSNFKCILLLMRNHCNQIVVVLVLFSNYMKIIQYALFYVFVLSSRFFRNESRSFLLSKYRDNHYFLYNHTR